eukprot:jgi/Picre1/27322/NNA_000291.t1
MTRVISTADGIRVGVVGDVSRCENIALNTCKGSHLLDNGSAGRNGKRALECVHEDHSDKHELKRIRIKRNVKWASTLEEFWDGLKRRDRCVGRKRLSDLLKKSVVRQPAPVLREQGSMSPVSDASDTSCQLIEDDAVKRPRRLKFTLRCGRKDSSATSTYVTLSSM